MALTIRKVPMPADKVSIKCPYTMNPTRIVIHNTANDAPAANEIAYMQSNANQVSFHFAVDDKEAVQGVEMWRNAWHAGDGLNGKGNREGIAIEICYSKSGGDRFKKAEENAAELTAKLLLDFGWGIDKVTTHQSYSGKNCPHRTLDLGWDRFLKMVETKRSEMLSGISAKTDPDVVQLNGYTLERAKDFSIVYWDKSKKKGTAKSYINGGFFAPYKENGVSFTIPVGNLVCDISLDEMQAAVKYTLPQIKYLKPFVHGKKLYYGAKNNASGQFRGYKVTTLVLPTNGKPYVDELSDVPSSARYAISGIPVIRSGVDVSYNSFVRPQGWDTSPFYATSRNFIGLKGTSIWIVTGTSKTDNFVAKSEVYEKLKSFGFEDLIALDGGGSFYHKYNGKASFVWSDRNVNNLVVFG